MSKDYQKHKQLKPNFVGVSSRGAVSRKFNTAFARICYQIGFPTTPIKNWDEFRGKRIN